MTGVRGLTEIVEDIGVVDAHCHPFLPEDAGRDLASVFSLSEVPLAPGMTESTMLVRRLVRDLAAFLGCAPDPATVDAERRRVVAADRDAYIGSLFRDAGIEQLVCDTGHPVDAERRPVVPLSTVEAVSGVRCREVFRIDTTIDRLLAHGVTFDELVEGLDADLDAAAAGVVAFKSVIAYRTGLDVELVGEAEARRSHDAVLASPDRDRSPLSKPLHDHLFVRSLERAIHHDLPMQIHTGIGDGPIFDLTTARPALLRRVLTDPALRRATLVLTHGGYPWAEETGWLASQYDNVYVDLSEMIPFATHGVSRKLLGMLELAPTSKLMYGSDGFNVAEMYWFGARLGRQAVTDALRTMIDEGWIDEREAVQIAESILRRTAIDLYRLDEPNDHRAGGTTDDG